MNLEETTTLEARETPAAENRHRMARWAEEGQHLLRILPGILAENDRLRARAEAAEQECERLRQEISEVGDTLRKALTETFQPLSEALQRLRAPQRRNFSEP